MVGRPHGAATGKQQSAETTAEEGGREVFRGEAMAFEAFAIWIAVIGKRMILDGSSAAQNSLTYHGATGERKHVAAGELLDVDYEAEQEIPPGNGYSNARRHLAVPWKTGSLSSHAESDERPPEVIDATHSS